MYRKILVPLDGSAEAERVLNPVLNLARATQAELVLLRVPVYAYARSRDHHVTAILAPLPGDRKAALDECKRYLNKLRNNLIRLGLRVQIAMPEGQAAARIVEYAKRPDIDLIAMTTHKPTRLQKLFFGSIVDKVMRRTNKPVLVLREDSPAQSPI